MHKIGIKQGRLSPRPYPKLQQFPSAAWREEFFLAKKAGYDYIEWMFDYETRENPIKTENGCNEICDLISKTGISVQSICADYFLVRPFYREQGYTQHDNQKILETLIQNAAHIGAELILLPVLENAEIRNMEEQEQLIIILNNVLPLLECYGVRIGLETDMPSNCYKELCDNVGSKMIGAYYDIGNAAACGYDIIADLRTLQDSLMGIHVKDRKLHGNSVFLGTGDVNLPEVICALLHMGYQGNFTFETYFEDNAFSTAVQNLHLLQNILIGGET